MSAAAKKSKPKNVKLAEAYQQLTDALATEAITGKNYRGIQKALMCLKRKKLTQIRCNSKKICLIAEAQYLLARRAEWENKCKNFSGYSALAAA